MRILHAFKVFPPDVRGGIPEVIAYLARGMSPRHESSVLVARDMGFGRSYVWNGIQVRATSSLGTILSTPLAPTFPTALARLSRTADLVALHQPFPLNDLGAVIGLPKRAAVVLYWHSEILGREPLVRMLEPLLRHTVKRADQIIVSDPALITVSPMLRDQAHKCAVVSFGIDASYWGTLDNDEQQRVNELREKHPRLIVTTGRLVPYKGFSVLIDAVRRVDATVAIIGSGPLHAELESMAQKLGVTCNILLPGSLSRSELKVMLHAARVYAMSSITFAETFSIAQVEAMAAGLPVINTDLPTGVPHVARHGLEGLTVPPNDPQQLAKAINQLLADPELSRRLGAAGRERAATEYGLSKFISRTEDVYNAVVAARSREFSRRKVS
ncbi:MAG: glycosyltransferase [Xanthobacteraceae bacterium]